MSNLEEILLCFKENDFYYDLEIESQRGITLRFQIPFFGEIKHYTTLIHKNEYYIWTAGNWYYRLLSLHYAKKIPKEVHLWLYYSNVVESWVNYDDFLMFIEILINCNTINNPRVY